MRYTSLSAILVFDWHFEMKKKRAEVGESHPSFWSFFIRWLVESLPWIFLLFLVDDDSDDETGNAAEDSEEEDEEHLEAGHGAGLGVLNVVPGGLEQARRRIDLGTVFCVSLEWMTRMNEWMNEWQANLTMNLSQKHFFQIAFVT